MVVWYVICASVYFMYPRIPGPVGGWVALALRVPIDVLCRAGGREAVGGGRQAGRQAGRESGEERIGRGAFPSCVDSDTSRVY
jgi:hypothetical protein